MDPGAFEAGLGAALDRGERAPLVRAVAGALAQGVTPSELARSAWSWALAVGGAESRGARWSHALLTLAAASALDRRLGSDLGAAAVANSLDFLCCSRPTRSRGAVVEPGAWQGGDSWRSSIREGRLAEAEASLMGALCGQAGDEELAAAWFEAGSETSSGWGHGAIAARSFWAVADEGLARRDDLLRAGLRFWIPFEPTPDLNGGLQRWSGGGPASPRTGANTASAGTPRLGRDSSSRVSDHPDLLPLSQAILEGRGEPAFGAALRSGAPAAVLAAAACIAACRVLVARPGLRQLHGLTFSRAILDAVRVSDVDVRAPLWLVQDFVAESWRLALRSGRVVHPEDVLGRHEPPGFDEGERWAAIEDACRLEATPAFGHTLKLGEACLDLESSLPARLSGWPTAALLAVQPTWPRAARPWLALQQV